MSTKLEHRVYTKGDKTALLSISENLVLTTIDEKAKMCPSEKEGHVKLRTLGYKKAETMKESFVESLDEARDPQRHIKVGSKVRSYDFPGIHDDHYIEGHVTGVTPHSYHIDVHKVVRGGKDIPTPEHMKKVEAPRGKGYFTGHHAVHHLKESIDNIPVLEGEEEWAQAAIDEAASPTAGTRLVKKYGDDANRAEVRYNPDYQEYQVHHYKDGKHMGEGPVSYHGDDKSDAHDTAKAEVAKRSTVKEDLNEESHEALKKMSNYHYKESDYHARKAGELENNNPKKVRHIEAANKHSAASIHYDKASTAARREDGEKSEYHSTKAGEYADDAEEHERTHHLMEALEEAHKLGDQVMIHKGSMAGTKGTIGEIRPGMYKGAPKTYTIDYSEPGKESRQSVQVKKEHIKAIKEDTDQLAEGTFKYHMDKAIAAHEKGDDKKKAYHLENAKTARYALKSTEYTKNKDLFDKYKSMTEDADQLDELKKSTLASYTQKAAGSMASSAFGQGQSSAQYKEPQEKDVKMFSKRLKGIGTATAKLAKEDLDEARGDADELWDKAEEHKKLANANKNDKEKFHTHMFKHHELISQYHSDLGQHNAAEKHDKKADDHYNKAAGFGVDEDVQAKTDDAFRAHLEKVKKEKQAGLSTSISTEKISNKPIGEAVIDPEDKRNPDIPTYLRKKQGQKPLSYAEVKARSTKNVDAYRKRAGVLENTVEIFPELASIVKEDAISSVKFKNGETKDVTSEHANALINLHGMLSDENKQKLAEYAHHSAENFSKVVDWALTKIK